MAGAKKVCGKRAWACLGTGLDVSLCLYLLAISMGIYAVKGVNWQKGVNWEGIAFSPERRGREFNEGRGIC